MVQLLLLIQVLIASVVLSCICILVVEMTLAQRMFDKASLRVREKGSLVGLRKSKIWISPQASLILLTGILNLI